MQFENNMTTISLLDYLNSEGILEDDIYDSLKYELNKHIYYFGDHFKFPQENPHESGFKRGIKQRLKSLYVLNKLNFKTVSTGKPSVLSNAYFNFNDTLEEIGYSVVEPFWAVMRRKNRTVLGDFSLYRNAIKLQKKLVSKDFNELISPPFFEEVKQLRETYTKALFSSNIKALFVPNDMSFFENYSLKIFREIQRPSFVFLHGIPGRYNNVDDNRADHLIVWGDRIKDLYVKAGVPASKIFVSGHPTYTQLQKKEIRSGLSDVLVLAKIGAGSPITKSNPVFDRGNTVVYLLSIQAALRKSGVKSVRLRVHPSANVNWLYKFIDKDFFQTDELPLSESLDKCSLVIGPTSTVFFEALYKGLNYMVYEPGPEIGLDILKDTLVEPFDGSDKRAPFARTQEDLCTLIKENVLADQSIFHEYIHPEYNIEFIKSLTV